MPDVYAIDLILILWIVIIVGHKCPTIITSEILEKNSEVGSMCHFVL